MIRPTRFQVEISSGHDLDALGALVGVTRPLDLAVPDAIFRPLVLRAIMTPGVCERCDGRGWVPKCCGEPVNYGGWLQPPECCGNYCEDDCPECAGVGLRLPEPHRHAANVTGPLG